MSANRILVVEDEAIVATAIKTELEQFGYAVAGVASSAVEAVAKAAQGKPDLVLMDIHLEGEKDGIEAAHQIRSRCDIPVVYLSAFADADILSRASETGGFGYLLKPYEERELQTTIEMALAKHRAERRLAETERLLSAILEGINDAVIATYPKNQIRYMNVAGEGLTGWCYADIAGSPLAAVCNLMVDGRRVLLEDLVDKTIGASRTTELPATTRLIARDGRETPVEGCLTSMYDRRGEFLGDVLTLRNITARLEMERVRRESEKKTRQARQLEAVRRLAGRIGLDQEL
jgi:PAS domain S-box-containing protein